MKKNQLGGLSPNKQNKYSIRKYTVGTASLLIGSTLIFGVHAKDANAAEEVAKQTLSAEENKEESVDQSKELNDEEIPQVNQQNSDVTEEENVVEDLPEEENATEEETQDAEQPKKPKQDEKATEKQQSGDKATSEKKVTPTQKSTEEEKATTVDQNKEQQAPTPERKTTEATSDVASKAVTNSTETQAPVNTEKAALATQANGLADTVKQVASLTSNEEKEEKLVDYYSKNAGVNSETAKQVVQGMNLDYQNLDSDQLTAEMLIALANKQEKNTPKATPVSLRSPKNLMRAVTLGDAEPQNSNVSGTSKNVNDLIRSNTELTVNGKEDGTVVPGQSTLTLKSIVEVDDKVKAGDYFTIKYSDTIQVYGANPEDTKNIGNIIDNRNGETIATVTHDINNKTITYKFTDYVDKFNSVKMKFNYNLFIDPSTLPENRKNVPFTVAIGNDSTSVSADITYSNYVVQDKNSIGTAFTETVSHVNDVKDPGHYIQVIYANPLGNALENASLKVKSSHPSFPNNIGQISESTTKIEIYEVPEGYHLNRGFSVKKADLKNVTAKYHPVYTGNNEVNISLGNIKSPYVIVVDGKLKPTESEVPELVQLATLSSTGNKNATNGNALKFPVNTSNGASNGEKVYRIGNYVWEDTNKDGIQNETGAGIGGVKVTLIDKETNQPVQTQETSENGSYLFENVKNGNYIVKFETPKGYQPTEKGKGGSEKDSNGIETEVTVNNADDLTIDSGFYKPTYKVGNYVWEDTNKDGVQNEEGTGIGGVKVTLIDKETNQPVQTQETSENGSYLFENVKNGNYIVKFETPKGYQPTEKGKGGSEKDSNGIETEVTVNNADDLTIDSGFYKPTYKVGNYVWEDTNKNGIQDEDEKGIKGVKVTLKDSTGEELDTTVTNDKGEYEFKDLPNGEYQVDFETPEGYVPTVANTEDDTKDSDGPLNAKGVIKDEDNLTVDQGFYKKEEPPVQKPATYKVGDKVWNDTNKDGIQNVNEPGISGVTVTLKQPDGTLITTKTDKDGNYIFKDLPNGKYEISFETPEGYEATTENVGDDRRLDSDGKTVTVEVNNADDLTIDSGFYKKEEPPVQKPATYKVGDKVWNDTNKDGIQNVNEPGISGVTVTLKQPDGTLITTKTDKDGNYIFKDLPNGKYEISFETPEGYEATTEKAGDDRRLDSDGKTVTVEVNNADDLTIDSGFYKKEEPPVQKPATYKVGDKVWHDTNKDGIQNVNEPGISGVTVTLKQPDGTLITTKTDKDGNYIFKDLPNGKYEISFETPEGYEATTENVGDDRRLDSDGKTVTVEVNNADDLTIDSGFYKKEEPPVQKPATYKVGDKVWNDTNKDGIQNVNEPGISGVTVTLKQPDGTLITTKTDKDGNYIFKDLPNGKYEISFETPEGYEATTANVGDDALDLDGTKVEVEVNNADDLTIDSGFYKPVVEPPKTDATYKVGDKVWNDTNKDGIQNANEAGIEGVKVTLTKADGTTVETRTDKDGNYIFTDLPNGKYEISFETPEGYEATTANVGDDALDSDGTKVEVEVNNADDLTIDSGFYRPVVEPPKTDATYKVGDKVWNDTNKDGIQNANEAGIEGVKVTLTKADGTTVETRTDKDGNYIFTDLPNGKYEISFETPEGYEATTENVGDDALDSDGTKVEVEVNNADDLTIDSGFYKPTPEVPTPEVPEQPGNPEVPTPEVPEQPGNPEVPTPEVPEQPGNPEVPAPEVPEQPGNPEVPAPEVPEHPGNPEVPTPEVPEQPGNPEVPTPEVPEQPGNPEVPTPEVPEHPGNPEVPTPEVPEQPGNPETPAPNMPEQPGQPKVEKAMPSTPQKAESKHKKEKLPETGQENAGQTTLLGSLFAALGGAFLLGRRRKDKKEQ